ncbi:MAG TPA: AAA family ATPase [Thermoanaerobaculia bacterium]|nr:AAA family ATPase [Thermoanaerobaculia bacterium]
MPVRLDVQIPRPEDKHALQGALLGLFENKAGNWFASIVEPQNSSAWHVRIEGPNGFVWSEVFDGPDQLNERYVAASVEHALTTDRVLMDALELSGFGPFRQTEFRFRPLEVLVGANGTGKTSLFDFLRALREYTRSEIPPEIIPGWETREVYHRPGADRLVWRLRLHSNDMDYSVDGAIIGPPGNPSVNYDRVHVKNRNGKLIAQLDRTGDKGWLFDDDASNRAEIRNQRPNQLALRAYVSKAQPALNRAREIIDSWRFYSGIRFNDQQLRRPALIEKKPSLREDGGNLASVLNWLQTEYRTIFNEIETHLRGIVPAFRGLELHASGAGRVTLKWNEHGLISPLSAADLSDGSLRLLLWITLALAPNPPLLVCIDEPEVGLHPRTLPKIAGLLQKLSDRTQVIVATHSSYLLTQFDIADIGILRKTDDGVELLRPASSAALVENLKEFGTDEIELMHRSNELEALT